MGIYDNIRAYSKALKIPVSAIEKDTGLAQGSICKWNDVSPSVNSLQKVADYMKLPITALIGKK